VNRHSRLLGLLWILGLTTCGEVSTPAAAPETVDIPSSLLALGYGGAATGDHLPGVSLRAPGAGSEILLTTDGVQRCLAIDRRGEVIWSRVIPGRSRVELFAPLEDGGILALSTDEGLTRLSATGEVQWQVELAAHHELSPANDGSFLTATHRVIDYLGRRVRFDAIERVSSDGQVTQVLDLFDLRAELIALGQPSPLDKETTSEPEAVYDRFHLNSVQILPESDLGQRDKRFAAGNLLLCLRNADLILIINPISKRVLWHLESPSLDRPHGARLNQAGQLSIFDNGWHRGRSRALIVDTESGAVLREEDGGEAPFFTRTRGFVQQLDGGRLLLTLSEEGRVLEYDSAGDLVFEWASPLRSKGPRSALYRVVASPAGFPPH